MALTKTDEKEIGIIARKNIKAFVKDDLGKEIADWMKAYHRQLYIKGEIWKRLT